MARCTAKGTHRDGGKRAGDLTACLYVNGRTVKTLGLTIKEIGADVGKTRPALRLALKNAQDMLQARGIVEQIRVRPSGKGLNALERPPACA